jgi:hypothetical protein
MSIKKIKPKSPDPYLGKTVGDNTLARIAHVNQLVDQINNNPAVIETLGTTIYSTSPATSNFSILNSILLGSNAGSGSNAYGSIFLGPDAGNSATNSYDSVFIADRAGYQSTGSNNSIFIGPLAGYQSTNANECIFLGRGSGQTATNTNYSVFIGRAGSTVNNSSYSNFIGYATGDGANGALYSNFIGYNAGKNSTGTTVNAIGKNAGIGNALSGMTIISNSSLPSYTNRTAATTAITIGNGGVAGNTYLYYNQATFAIEGVRL